MSFKVEERGAVTRLLVMALVGLVVMLAAIPGADASSTHGAERPGPPAQTQAPDPQGESLVWQQGREVRVGLVFGTTDPPARHEVDVYLIGPIDLDSPQDDGRVRGGPNCDPLTGEGGCIHVPKHDDAFPPNVRGYQTRASTQGYWVLASPDAPEGAVRTREVGRDDLPETVGQPYGDITELAYEIRVGNRYQPLTSTHWVEHGLRRGWLDLSPLGSGGTAWVIDRHP